MDTSLVNLDNAELRQQVRRHFENVQQSHFIHLYKNLQTLRNHEPTYVSMWMLVEQPMISSVSIIGCSNVSHSVAYADTTEKPRRLC
jgi:hypothetical protein